MAESLSIRPCAATATHIEASAFPRVARPEAGEPACAGTRARIDRRA